MLALFVGLAGAQVGTGTGSTGGTLSCTAVVSAPPTLRAEGLTELIGDIVIQCTGGSQPGLGVAVPTANFTVSLGTNVTSRLLSNGGSEALLLIDEPGSGETGAGASEPILVCNGATTGSGVSFGAGAGGCSTSQGTVTTPGGATTAACLTGSIAAGVCTTITTTSNTSVPNAFQGIVSGNQVTFNGVPILAPTTTGLTRVFRITNVRANVAGLGGGGLPGTTQLLASVAISGSTALPVSNPVQIAGFVQSGLSTRVRNNGNTSSSTLTFPQCNNAGGSTSSNPPAGLSLLEFKENFGTAFKTRVATTTTYNGAGINIAPTAFAQGTPAVNYNSESGLIVGTPNGTAGLADFGTRLKAVFNNIPAGVTIWVTTTNLVATNSAAGSTTTVANTAVTNGGVTPTVAVQVPSESGTNFAGLTPPGTTFGTASLAQVPIVGGSGEAVWEIVQANPAAIDTVQFGVLITFVGNQATGTPAATTTTAQPVVNLSYAPTATANTFTASAGAAASSSLPIPRFQDTSTAANILTISLCQTDLLFPFVTNINGFDTGIAIANTTTDPFGTSTQAGTCTLNFYGSGAPSAVTTPVVATGTDYANTASTIAPGFQGYMIAVCNFQYAHGFAFVSDVGARNLAMGYLPLIMNGSGGALATRGQQAEAFAQ